MLSVFHKIHDESRLLSDFSFKKSYNTTHFTLDMIFYYSTRVSRTILRLIQLEYFHTRDTGGSHAFCTTCGGEINMFRQGTQVAATHIFRKSHSAKYTLFFINFFQLPNFFNFLRNFFKIFQRISQNRIKIDSKLFSFFKNFL